MLSFNIRVNAIAIIMIFFLIHSYQNCSASGFNYITIIINGKTLKEKALTKDSFVYVPLDAIATSLGSTCEWDPVNKRAMFNGKPIKGKAYKVEGLLYVSAITISENIGARVKYDAKNNVVTITTDKSSNTIPTPVPTSNNNTNQGSISEPFIPKHSSNDVFKVSITNVETVNTVKGHYVPKAGNKFVIIYLSQQNISDEVQIYTGKLTMVDSANQAFEYVEGLSNFWLLVLKPGGINFGYLVFEIPANVVPMKMILATTTRPPLTVNLR